ncbi:MAG: AMP-binding protein [Acidiferrobacter sp.]
MIATSPALNDSAPLVVHQDGAATVAFYRGAMVSRAQFLADVRCVAAALPDGGPVLNGCTDRYHFAVGLAAAIVAGCVSVLPSTYAPETIRQLQENAPGVYGLFDDDRDIGLPRVQFPVLTARAPSLCAADVAVPRIPLDQRAVTVYTSGTTGLPVGHHKTWGSLVAGAQLQAQRLGVGQAPPYSLVGTVPPQHMYGLESTIMLALQGGVVLSAERPFYPQDIVSALGAVPRPRLLVTSPVHLRALLASGLETPPIDMILCATAPLPMALAQEAEQRLAAPLFEIYGATEAGQIASRRSTADPYWQLFSGLALEYRQDELWVHGGHVQVPALLHDILEPKGPQHFVLQGRGNDIINVAGKRSSLAFLEQQLLGIPGVVDGTFYMPDSDIAGPVARLMAFAIAPSLTVAAIDAALRTRIDPAFLPRPLYLVDGLPRLATGKLPLAAIRNLALRMSEDVTSRGRG